MMQYQIKTTRHNQREGEVVLGCERYEDNASIADRLDATAAGYLARPGAVELRNPPGFRFVKLANGDLVKIVASPGWED